MIWMTHNEFHRDGGLPAYVDVNGAMQWYERGIWKGNQVNPPPNARFPGQKTKSANKK